MEVVEAIYTRFGRELRRVRRQKRMTQDDLAQRVNLGRTSIVNIESGRQRVHLHTFVDLAEALEISATELLPDEPESVPEIADRVDTLPAPERDWVMRVVSTPARQTRRRKTDGAKTQ
jgi:transcriptional regulator with XRE-family HTH domain